MKLPMTLLPTPTSADSLYTTPQPLPDSLTSPQVAVEQSPADTLASPPHADEQSAAKSVAKPVVPIAEQPAKQSAEHSAPPIAAHTTAQPEEEAVTHVTDQTEEHAAAHTAAQPKEPRQTYPLRVRCTRDSLWMHECSRIASPAAPYRDTTARAVYGEESTLVRTCCDAPNDRPLTNDALFQGFVLLLGTTYMLSIYSNMIDVRTLLNRVFRDRASNSEERRFDDPSGGRYVRFMHTMAVIGMLCIGVSVVKYGQPLIELLPFEGAPIVAVLASGLAVSALFLLIAGYQWTLLRTVGALTLTQPLVAQLRQLRTLYFAAVTLLAAPTLLLLAFCPPHTGKLWFALIVIELSVTLFLYIKETLTLFLSKKVSILHWILYLCGVELFPVSLLWLLAVR
ncbi:MAG: DUF4271 domain-containing protein [Alistipes senegalensis]|nr:DUF4271 domain-containing protein [Bacteroides cellulosilyticus]MCM1351662.1 DUF4271 domain-containing protein [Alistipes senegalensis]